MTHPLMQHPLMRLGYSHADILRVYQDQVVRLAERVKLARVATNNGAGGKDGKRYEGKFMHQIEAQYEDAIQSVKMLELMEG